MAQVPGALARSNVPRLGGLPCAGASKIPGATHAEIAALDFVPEQFNMTKAQRIERAREMTESIHGAMLIALELLVVDKSALIARVREEHDELGAALLPLASAREAAETLRDLIGSAECRLAVALANVEPDEDDYGEDDEDDAAA
jgi:hypothetical protein